MRPHRLPTTAKANGAPPCEAAALYSGTVMHARLKPFSHRFTYRVFNLLIDIDRQEEAAGLSRFFSVCRFNLASFHPEDHGPRDGSSLRIHVDGLLAAHGLAQPARRVMLLCYPRILGYVFNPLSVFYVYGENDELIALIYEVRNTFGGMHTYVEPVRIGQVGPQGVRQERAKAFYVSPFIEMEQKYQFRMLPPGESVRVRILESDKSGPILSATFIGARKQLKSLALIALCAKIPLLTLKVVAAIHWEAFKIWLKGAPFHSPGAHSTRQARGQPAKGLTAIGR